MAPYKKYLSENPWGVRQTSIITWTAEVQNDSVVTQKTTWETETEEQKWTVNCHHNMQAKGDVEKWVTEVLSGRVFFTYFSVTWKKQVSN